MLAWLGMLPPYPSLSWYDGEQEDLTLVTKRPVEWWNHVAAAPFHAGCRPRPPGPVRYSTSHV